MASSNIQPVVEVSRDSVSFLCYYEIYYPPYISLAQTGIMKTYHLLICSLFLLILFSCKKETSPEIAVAPAVIAVVRDSVSLIIGEKVYRAYERGTFRSLGNAYVNQKVLFAPDGKNYQITFDKDSLYFFTTNEIISDELRFKISFGKKFIKTQLAQRSSVVYSPTEMDQLLLYALGKHPYAIDFNRNYNQNGIAIEISDRLTGYTTYLPGTLLDKDNSAQVSQQDAKFEIITLVKTSQGGYNIEAKFSANIYDHSGNKKRIEGGYLHAYMYNFGE